MKKHYLLLLLVTFALYGYGQTCTISGSGTINWNAATCQGGVSLATATLIIVPSGVNLTFTTDPAKTANIIVQSGGTLTNDKANAKWNGDITINSGATFTLNQKLDLGTGSGCGYDLVIYGSMTLNGSGGSDLLSICGVKIAQSGGSCNNCGGTNSGTCAYNGSPYCEPGTGFTGPLGYSEGGYNASLPVQIAYFTAKATENSIQLEWATSSEENFSKFEIERSENGRDFENIGEIAGAGKDLFSVVSKYQFEDKAPLLGYTYYRLKAVDLDDTFEYFGLKAIKISGEKEILIYPNPASADRLNFVSNFNPSEGDRIVLKNAVGKDILQRDVVTNKLTIFPSEELNPGVYFLEYRGLDFKQTIRIVVTK
jgi:hypothetical protein